MKIKVIKKIFVFFIVLLTVGFFSACSNPLTDTEFAGARTSQRSVNKPILSEMSEQECIEFIIKKGVTIPDFFINRPNLGAFVKSSIQAAERNPNVPPAYSWGVSFNFAESIQTAVNEYYGSARRSATAARSAYTLKDSWVWTKSGVWGDSGGYWNYEWYYYNCYAYAIDITGQLSDYPTRKSPYCPGDFSHAGEKYFDEEFWGTNSIHDLAMLVKEDLEFLGADNVQVIDTVSYPVILQTNQKLICVRMNMDYNDFHFMKYNKDDNSENDKRWYHKPSLTAPLKYKYEPSDYTWTNEYSYKGIEANEDPVEYDSDVWYIFYDDWPTPADVTIENIPLDVPVDFAVAQTTIDTIQYAGTVRWLGDDDNQQDIGLPYIFAEGIMYTAEVTLWPKTGYTLQNLPANFFKVNGGKTKSEYSSGRVRVKFTQYEYDSFDIIFDDSHSTIKTQNWNIGPIGRFILFNNGTWGIEEVELPAYTVYFDPKREKFADFLSWDVPPAITNYLAQNDKIAAFQFLVEFPVYNETHAYTSYGAFYLYMRVTENGAMIIGEDYYVNMGGLPINTPSPLRISPFDGKLEPKIQSEPHMISSYLQFKSILFLIPDGYFQLANDIIIPDYAPWNPVPEFWGELDGNGYTIYGLKMDSSVNNYEPMDFGLFLENHGTIKNLNVDVNVYDVECKQYGGAIAAVNHGIIENCNVSGGYSAIFQINSHIGGITGYNTETGVILNCTNNAAFNWYWCMVGGIAGLNAGTIEDSINTGDITYIYFPDENRSVGGIAGTNTGNILNCTNESIIISFKRVPFKSLEIPGISDNSAISAKIAAIEEKAKDYLLKPNFTGERSFSLPQNIDSSFVYTGGIAGINTGVIESSVNNNTVTHSNNHYAFVGGIAAFNNGQIVTSKNYGVVCNDASVGGIVGNNYGNISGNENYGQVYYYFSVVNGNAAGIAGIHNTGSIGSCGNYGTIEYAGIPTNSTVLQPAMGQIIGYHVSGNLINNNILSGSVNPGNLTTVNGFNQALYVSNGAVGRAF